jgi:hypothetical protein
LVLRGIAEGVPTGHLSHELDVDRSHFLERRDEIQRLIEQGLYLFLSPSPFSFPDAVTEADKVYQNAGGRKAVGAE